MSATQDKATHYSLATRDIVIGDNANGISMRLGVVSCTNRQRYCKQCRKVHEKRFRGHMFKETQCECKLTCTTIFQTIHTKSCRPSINRSP